MRLPNRTRTSPSIARRLLRDGKLHLLPVYALLRTSDLAREGIENSGSFRFADHVYRNEPSGRLGIGWLLDAILLQMRGARSMRSRHLHARREIVRTVRAHQGAAAPLRILSVPCGIARELVSAARELRADSPALLERCELIGMDADPAALELSRELAGGDRRLTFVQGDALDPASYPHRGQLDVVISTGLGEFLEDDDLQRFYRTVRSVLAPDGVFVTSGMRPDPVADYLMRELAELRARYRAAAALRGHLERAGFIEVDARPDGVGLQTLIVARGRSAADGRSAA